MAHLTQWQKNEIDDLVSSYLHKNRPHEDAPLNREKTEDILEIMRYRIANKVGMGITLTEDHNGVWNKLGTRLLTLRFGDKVNGDFYEVTMEIKQVISHDQNTKYNAMLRENK